jgi:hypothetical protein
MSSTVTPRKGPEPVVWLLPCELFVMTGNLPLLLSGSGRWPAMRAYYIPLNRGCVFFRRRVPRA